RARAFLAGRLFIDVRLAGRCSAELRRLGRVTLAGGTFGRGFAGCVLDRRRRLIAVFRRFWRRSVLRPVWIVLVSHPGSPSALAGSAIRPPRRRGAADAGLRTWNA